MKSTTKKASVLIFSIFIMTIMLSIALSVFFVSVMDMRSSIDTGNSANSFQLADAGANLLLQAKQVNPFDTIDETASAMGGIFVDGKIVSDLGKGEFEITLYDSNGESIEDPNEFLAKVYSIKSNGLYGNTERAVEVSL